MPDNPPQSFSSHARYDPLFHFFLAPVALILLIWSISHTVRHFSHESLAFAVGALLLFLGIFKTRAYALKVQDRVIRLEETLRLSSLSGGAPLPKLSVGQFVALRFASDAELPSLAAKAASGNLTSKQIKEQIQNWRPDYFRV